MYNNNITNKVGETLRKWRKGFFFCTNKKDRPIDKAFNLVAKVTRSNLM